MSKRFLILAVVALLLPAGLFAQTYSAILSGANEFPGPGDTDGSGFAVVRIDGTTIYYNVWTQGIAAPTLGHIHTGAAGVSGPPLVDFDVNQLTDGSIAVSQAVVDQIKANPGGFYVNVHTSEFPNGAVRGQLTAPSTSAGSYVSYLPVVSKTLGASGTNFVTDLRIVNVGGATATVTLDFYASNAAGLSAPTSTKTVTVAPGEQEVLNDLIGGTFTLGNTFGGLRISSTSATVATARVINDLRAQSLGTAGLALPAVEAGKMSLTIAFLGADTDYRTNIGYFNASATAVTATFVAHRSSDGAVLGSNTVSIPGWSMVQQPAFTLISSVPEGSRTQSDFYVTWTATAPLHVYGAVTDNRTGDAVVNQ